MELLHGLDDSALQRRGLHKEAGEITLSNLIHEWAFHDMATYGKSLNSFAPNYISVKWADSDATTQSNLRPRARRDHRK